MRRSLAATAVLALLLTGCGDTGHDPGGHADGVGSPSDAGGGAIRVEVEGDRVDPNGRRVQVEAGEKIRLAVDSDRPGEFHVHSSPEQTLPFPKGHSVVSLRIDTPGVVDVEEHVAGLVVLQLEVR